MTYTQRKAREKRRALKARTLAVIAVDRAEHFAHTAQRNLSAAIERRDLIPHVAHLHQQANTATIALANAKMVAMMHGGPVR